LWRFYYRSARALKRTGSSITTFTGIITTGIMAIGMPGSGTRVTGSNGVEPNMRGWTALMRIAKGGFPQQAVHFIVVLNGI
jgi:hypothetical protein